MCGKSKWNWQCCNGNIWRYYERITWHKIKSAWERNVAGQRMNINEIARLAGVSRATVSRYLNDGYGSEEKKQAIRTVIEKTGYQPIQEEVVPKLRDAKSRQPIQPEPGMRSLVHFCISWLRIMWPLNNCLDYAKICDSFSISSVWEGAKASEVI